MRRRATTFRSAMAFFLESISLTSTNLRARSNLHQTCFNRSIDAPPSNQVLALHVATQQSADTCMGARRSAAGSLKWRLLTRTSAGSRSDSSPPPVLPQTARLETP